MEKKGSIHWAWIILATCFMDLFINYSVRLGYSVVLPEMIRDLGFSRTAGGSIFNAYLFSYILLTPLSGYMTDRLGARRVITVCAFILGAGVNMMGTVQSLWSACVFYAISGVGATGMWTPVITVVQRWFSPNHRGLALGVLSTGYGLGFATMGLAFPWIVNHFSWRYSWYFLGTGALLMVALNGMFLRSTPESAGCLPWGRMGTEAPIPSGKRGDASGFTYGSLFSNRTFWLVGFSYYCVSYSLYGITTFMVDYAEHQLGLPLEKASLLATVHGIAQVLGVLTVLPLSDYLGRKKMLVFSNGVICGCVSGIILSGNSWVMLYVLVGLMAVFYGATFPMYGACAGDFFPEEVMGTVIGAWTPFYGAGAISVHWVSGLLRDATGGYQQAFLISGLMAGMATVLIALIRKG